MRTPCVLTLALLISACGGSGGTVAGDGPEFSATIVVTNLDDSGPGSLRDAIDSAPAGALIEFDPALPTDWIELLSELVPQVDLTISGLSGAAERMRIRAGPDSRIFHPEDGTLLELRDFILEGGNDGASGGAIRQLGIGGEIILRRVAIGECDAVLGAGGGVYKQGGRFEAEDCAFSTCYAFSGGAVSLVDVDAHFTRCSFYVNESDERGGAVALAYCTVQMTNCCFLSNHAGGEGGAVYARSASGGQESSVTATYCTVVGNSADGDFAPAGAAGGIHVEQGDAASALTIHASILTGNTGTGQPDIHLVDGATASGSWNRLGTGPVGALADGADNNTVGFAGGELATAFHALAFDSLARAYRTPRPLSGATSVIPHDTEFSDEDGPIETDHQGQPRSAGLAGEQGAVER